VRAPAHNACSIAALAAFHVADRLASCAINRTQYLTPSCALTYLNVFRIKSSIARARTFENDVYIANVAAFDVAP
jgi:hypothetical protein